MPTVKDVIDAMETIAPSILAVDGDPVGLHAGSPNRRVQKIMVALDASLAAIEEAEQYRADMLVVHHPRFYRGLSTVADTDASGRRAAAIIRSGIAVYSAHTNLDMAEGGTNDLLAELAGLTETEIVKVEKCERLLKLAVFIPETHMDKVLKAVCGAGAGHIGKYSDCTFRTRGTGTFRGGKNTKPFLGKPGVLEEADEYRLETVFGEFDAPRVIAAMLKAHPYEEVAYDLYPLLGGVNRYGFGRVGALPKRESLAKLAARMAKATASRMAQYHGIANTSMSRVAVWAGAGVDVKAVLASRADVIVAGEIGYHDLETFIDGGMAVITLGHGHSEEPILKLVSRALRQILPECEVKVGATSHIAMRNV